MSKTLQSLLVVLILITAVALTAPAANAGPFDFPGLGGDQQLTPCVIHCHGNIDDGIYYVEEDARAAKAHGAKVLVMTAHLEITDLTAAELDGITDRLLGTLRFIRRATKQTGIANYINDCKEATKKVGILVVPGVEVGIGTDRDWVFDPAGGNKWDNKVHLLGIGCITEKLATQLHNKLGHKGTKLYSQSEKTVRLDEAQNDIAKIMHDAGLAVVIAHPYLVDPIHGFNYTFYKNRTRYIHGVEFFNGSGANDENAMEAMGFINRDASMGPFKNLAVTSGCDFHGIPGSGDERFDRQTHLSVSLPATWDDNNFQDGCKAIANALRGDGSCAAGIKQTATSGLTNPLGTLGDIGSALSGLALHMSMYQDGNKVFGGLDIDFDGIDPARPFYIHVPGMMMARANLQSQMPPTVPPAQSPSDRVAPQRFGDLQIEAPNERWPLPLGFKAVGGVDEIEIVTGNQTGTTQILQFEPGMLFVAIDDLMGTRTQPLVVIQGARFEIPPGSNGTGRVKTLCANRQVGAPPAGKQMVYAGFNEVLGNAINLARVTGEDIQNAIWEYTDERTWNGASPHYKTIIADNKSNVDLTLHLAWHDQDGWHDATWEIKAGQKTRLDLRANQPISADRIKYWAEAVDGSRGWRINNEQDEVSIECLSDYYIVGFNN